ncbi:MAG TPA: M48 family metalloprotease [Solirubrobacteraceae bacterium]
MSRGLGLPAVMAAVVGVAEAAAAMLRPRDVGPGPVPAEARDYFSAAELGKARRYRAGQRRLSAAAGAIELAVVVAAVRRPPRVGRPPGRAAAIRRPAPTGRTAALTAAIRRPAPTGRRPELVGALTAAGLAAATTAAGLPARAAARERSRRVGLVTQSWAGWAGDVAKATAIGSALAAGGGAALELLRGRFGRDWWAPGAGLAAGWAVVFSTAAPVLLDPLFNRFTVMPEGDTRADVLALAAASGVDVGEVYEIDASRRTTGANAYVTGLGATKRVVLFDTLLRDFTAAEVRFVIAHELAHVRFRDVRRGLAWLALTMPAALFAVARLAERLHPPDATAVPATALALGLVATPVGIIGNQLSRAIERRADHYALGLTGEPGQLVDFERRICVKNVIEPRPPAWERALLATHPDTMERIGRALATDPDRARGSRAGA